MSSSFGAGALRLCGVAARMFGWRPDEFWRSTPAELAATLAPYESGAQPFGRDDLNRLMERDNDRYG